MQICTTIIVLSERTYHHDVRKAELVPLGPRDLAGAAAAHGRVLEGHDEALEHSGAVQRVVVREHSDLRVDVRQPGVHGRALPGLGLFHDADDGGARVDRLHDIKHL